MTTKESKIICDLCFAESLKEPTAADYESFYGLLRDYSLEEAEQAFYRCKRENAIVRSTDILKSIHNFRKALQSSNRPNIPPPLPDDKIRQEIEIARRRHPEFFRDKEAA
jgi:hypothetical protein